MANTGRKDAKGRIIYTTSKGNEYVLLESGRRSKPAIGRISRKMLNEKARTLSAKRIQLEKLADNVKKIVNQQAAKRKSEENARKRINSIVKKPNTANNVLSRLDRIVKQKASNVNNAVRKL